MRGLEAPWRLRLIRSKPSQDGEAAMGSGPEESDTMSDDGGRVLSFRLAEQFHGSFISQ